MIKVLTWQARTSKNIKLVKLSELTNISKTTLNDIENGKVSPTLHQLEKIAIALDKRISELYESENK